MLTVASIQQRLEMAADQEAMDRARRHVDAMPAWPGEVTIPRKWLSKEDDGFIVIQYGTLKNAIQRHFEREIRAAVLDRMTQELIARATKEAKDGGETTR